MATYYVSRALLAAILAALMVAFGLAWWAAALTGLLIFAAFVLLARRGRYVVEPEGGPTPMRRDEMGQEINRRAGLNGFVVLVLGTGGLLFYYGVVAHSGVPINLLAAALALGVGAYILTDYSLRRV